eukprot:scaffold134724_cov56-Attheya_sp.AAC.1
MPPWDDWKHLSMSITKICWEKMMMIILVYEIGYSCISYVKLQKYGGTTRPVVVSGDIAIGAETDKLWTLTTKFQLFILTMTHLNKLSPL